MKDRTIAIDFDGTIVDHKFPAIGALKPQAKRVINSLYQDYYIIIFSVRPTWGLFNGYPECVNEMTDFLRRNGIKYDYIALKKDGKPLADYYIDDRAIEFKNNWKDIQGRLK